MAILTRKANSVKGLLGAGPVKRRRARVQIVARPTALGVLTVMFADRPEMAPLLSRLQGEHQRRERLRAAIATIFECYEIAFINDGLRFQGNTTCNCAEYGWREPGGEPYVWRGSQAPFDRDEYAAAARTWLTQNGRTADGKEAA